jgi:hypothetical protein
LCSSSPLAAQKKLMASEAKDHIGETATLCGSVVSTRYAASTKGQPTFLNLDKPYPNPVFTVLIWGESRSKFGTPESEYKGKRICVTEKITEYRGGRKLWSTTQDKLARIRAQATGQADGFYEVAENAGGSRRVGGIRHGTHSNSDRKIACRAPNVTDDAARLRIAAHSLRIERMHK